MTAHVSIQMDDQQEYLQDTVIYDGRDHRSAGRKISHENAGLKAKYETELVSKASLEGGMLSSPPHLQSN